MEHVGESLQKSPERQEFVVNEVSEYVTNWTAFCPYFGNSFDDIPDASFGEISVAQQEKYIVEDIIHCLIGCDGEYVRVVCNEDGKKSFRIPSSMDISLQGGMADGILPIIAHYYNITEFIEDNRLMKYGRINQLLSYALRDIIDDYYRFQIVKLERELREDASLLKLRYYIQRILPTMEYLNRIIKIIRERKARGVVTLSILHNEVNSSCSSERMQLVETIICKTCISYFESLDIWIRRGHIFDPHNEFMIVDNKELEKDMYKLHLSTMYWQNRFTIREGEVPSFLEFRKQMVLRSGKYLNTIKQCNREKFYKIISDNKKECVEIKFVTLSDTSYLDTIETVYKRVSKELLQLIKDDYNIMERLRSLKRYLLMEQGDFIVALMESCEEELLKPRMNVTPEKLALSLELCLSKSSAARVDPYKEDIVADLLQYDLQSQVNRYGLTRGLKRIAMTVLDAFTLSLTPTWPVSLIVNDNICFYQMIFRLLFKCKYIEKELHRVFICDKQFKTSKQKNANYRKAFLLRHEMISYERRLLYYIGEEVIERNWSHFIDATKNKAENIDDFKNHHLVYLQNCLKGAGLDNPVFISLVLGMLKICHDFCNFMQSHFREIELNPEVEVQLTQTFEQNINTFEKDFAVQRKLIQLNVIQ